MKKILRLYSFIFILTLVFNFCPALAVTNLSNVLFDIDPKIARTNATWTIGFSLPEDAKIGHILISLTGYTPDLSSAKLSVAGLPKGTAILGKSNPSCVSNCDDIRYYFTDPVSVKAGTKITFTLSNVNNPDKAGQTGINFINIFNSKYPKMDLAYSSNDYLIKIVAGENDAENLIPNTATDEGQKGIQDVLINELFYKEGARTTKLSEITDAAKVENFTLDLLGKIRVTFKEPIDLSKEEAIDYITNLADYMTFEYLYFWVDQPMMDYFKVPLEITFYNLPYVWESDVLKDDQTILAIDKLEGYHSAIVDDQAQISFTVKEGGSYQVIPRFEIYITDNQEITAEKNLLVFSGRISDTAALVKISLNGKELPDVVSKIDSGTGDFSFTVQLAEGVNLIEAAAQSNYGEIKKITRMIQYHNPALTVKQEKSSVSPINIIAIILALLAIMLIISLRYLIKKRKK